LNNHEIIIVNDNPQESLKSELSSFKNITLIENEINLGFGSSVNNGIKEATHDYCMLLNTDVLLFDDSYKKAFSYFKDPTTFAVTFAQKEANDELVGKNKIYWRNGFFQHTRVYDLTWGENGWAEGGSCIMDRKKLMKLQGFDPIYNPFYWEDIDLSYRAWKSKYKIIFAPEIIVEHHHESTIGSYFSKDFIQTIAYRNQLLFIWKNISDQNLLTSHFFHLSKMILISILKGNKNFLRGFAQALQKTAEVKQRRKSLSHSQTDHDILQKFH
jgi:GT2 family glycosyltransferase